MKLKKVGETNFRKIISSEKPVIIDFAASWCSTSLSADKLLCEFSQEHPQIDIFRLCVDDNMDITNLYGVMNVPTLLLFKNKKVLQKLTGNFTKDDISNFIKEG